MIELQNVTIQGGPFEQTPVSFRIETEQYAVLMGQTGQGKSTVLEAICGLRRVTGGRILIDDQDMTTIKPSDRGVGYVPQDLALFPQMTVQAHLEFALKLRRIDRSGIRRRVMQLAETLEISHLLSRGIGQLSGGEAQRVALGRALAFEPRTLLLDEPLAALDESTRERMCRLLKSIHASRSLTTLHVTHHRSEALLLSQVRFIVRDHQILLET